MREILFRGQTRKKGQKVWMDGTPVDGQWVYGGVLQGIGDFSVIYGGKNTNDPSEGLEKWCVYTDTLGQFTGLTDKNGKKIFEGDILQSWSDYYKKYYYQGVVRYGEFNCSCCDGVYGWYLDGGDIRNIDSYEVCGNIHDNPELMEVTDNA